MNASRSKRRDCMIPVKGCKFNKSKRIRDASIYTSKKYRSSFYSWTIFFVSIYPAAIPGTYLAVFLVAVLQLCWWHRIYSQRVCGVLTDSKDANAYWRKLKQRLKKEGNETVTNCHGVKLHASDGKLRLTDVADTEQLFRIIQSIPSPKAEPFKVW